MNEQYAGQVVCGYASHGYHDQQYLDSNDSSIFYMPCVTDLYPDIADDTATKFITEMSCDERAVHHPQSIACNITASNLLFNYCNTFLNASRMEGIASNAVIFNVLTNGFKTYQNTKDQIAKRYIMKHKKAAAG